MTHISSSPSYPIAQLEYVVGIVQRRSNEPLVARRFLCVDFARLHPDRVLLLRGAIYLPGEPCASSRQYINLLTQTMYMVKKLGVVFTLTQIQEVLELCATLRVVQELKLIIANPYFTSSLENALTLTRIRVVLSAKFLLLYPVLFNFVGKATGFN